jgi:hypothetical protein
MLMSIRLVSESLGEFAWENVDPMTITLKVDITLQVNMILFNDSPCSELQPEVCEVC